ncbi:hypothetical protein GCM10027037_09200 [Mucilaginibacter koreensis]
MLRKAIAYVLITALLAVNCGRFFAYAGYELNKNYITTKLCENRSRPWLHCNGKCYLMKKLKQAEEKQNSTEKESQKNLFQEAFFAAQPKVVFSSLLIQVINAPYCEATPESVPAAIIHPPQLS